MKFVPYWRSAWRLFSVSLGTAATVVTSWLILFPEAVVHAWAILPAELKAQIPPRYVMFIGVVLMAGAVLSRLVHQPKAQAVIQEKLADKRAEEGRPDLPPPPPSS